MHNRAAVLTVSDSSSQGTRKDCSGPAVAEMLRHKAFDIVATEVVPDEFDAIRDALIRLSGQADFVCTTGGTGMAERDVTPEATKAVCHRVIDGLAERMRREGSKTTPYAALSRGVCGTYGRTLIVNLPGSPSAAVESLCSVVDLVPHALDLLRGHTSHEHHTAAKK